MEKNTEPAMHRKCYCVPFEDNGHMLKPLVIKNTIHSFLKLRERTDAKGKSFEGR